MNQTEVLEIMKTEKECVQRQGTAACPNRDCKNCDLLLPTEKVVEAYDVVIKMLEPWIQLTTRPMTEDEKQHYIDIGKPEVAEYGMVLNCPLPDDCQEVLVSCNEIVNMDVFYNDDDCYFEYADIDDVDAWMPLPKGY